jgi:mono/diheme cytochrome c family protein
MRQLFPVFIVAFLLIGCDESKQAPLEVTKIQTGEEIYLMYCSMCHGVTGDGKSTITLDRPARSFIDGGFSFGNTIEAISKTTRSGIPGTPMPPFADILGEEQTKKVANYVRSLAPTQQDVVVEETEMVVGDRPAVVRGMIPPIQEGLDLHPRGLVIGNPDGFSYEYRADDVRLLAIRQGRFVERSDWGARGGSPLTVLGKIIVLVDSGNPPPMFMKEDGKLLKAKLLSTKTLGSFGIVKYEVIDDLGESYAVIEEQCKTTTIARALIEQELSITAKKPFKINIPDGTVMDEPVDVPTGTSKRTIVHATKGSQSEEN